jgi:hypothetical protein
MKRFRAPIGMLLPLGLHFANAVGFQSAHLK